MSSRPSTSLQNPASSINRELSALVADAAEIEKLAVPAAFRISAAQDGPMVVVFGSIHGDEPAGSIAIKDLLSQFATGSLSLACGSLTLAVGNELALEQRVRKVERDLNRLFTPESRSDAGFYEEHRAEDLKTLLNGAAYLMDLHATSKPSPSFAMCEAHLLEEAQSMGFGRIVTGWGELGDATLGNDTESYCNAIGGKGFTIETGQRDDSDGPSCGVDAVRRLLRHAGLLAYNAPSPVVVATYKLFASIKVNEATFRYRQDFSSFDPLAEGELIGREENKEYRAPCECVLIMPSNDEYMLARRRCN